MWCIIMSPAIDRRPPSADKTTGLGSVGMREVFPAPASPYTRSFTPDAASWPVVLRLIAICTFKKAPVAQVVKVLDKMGFWVEGAKAPPCKLERAS